VPDLSENQVWTVSRMIRSQFFPDNSVSVEQESQNKAKTSRLCIPDAACEQAWESRSIPRDKAPSPWQRGEIYEKSALTKNAWHRCVHALSEAEPGIDWETRMAKFDMYGYGLFLGPLSEVERVRSTLPRRRVRLASGHVVQRPVGPMIADVRFRSRTKGV